METVQPTELQFSCLLCGFRCVSSAESEAEAVQSNEILYIFTQANIITAGFNKQLNCGHLNSSGLFMQNLIISLCVKPVYLSCSCVYMWDDEDEVRCLHAHICVQSTEQVFWRNSLVHLIGHTHANVRGKSLMVSLRHGQSHMEQTVMRKRISVFHQQLSPTTAPVSFKCTYIASGHAVAKEVLVSKQELAGKHPQSWFERLVTAGVDFKLHPFFIYVY